jgi:glycosyltransferase involved in cell wall biosynthesis
MVIGIDIRTLMEREHSGVPEFAHQLIRELMSLDTQNQYRLFFNSARDLSKNIPDFSTFDAEIVNTRYPNKVFNLIMQKTLGMPKIDRLLGCDLFFMPTINFISLSDQCRKIITVHDLSFLKHGEFFSCKRKLWHYLINVKKLLHQFENIVAVSASTKRDLIELCGIAPEKISVIHSGLSQEYRPIAKDDDRLQEVKKKYNLPDKFIFHLGTIEPRKNLIGLVKAYDYLMDNTPDFADYKLVIAGGSGWKNKEIYKTINRAERFRSIKHIGFMNKEDKVYVYNLASIFVYPSHYEGFGFPPLEAMASGTPVVTSSVSSLPEIAGKGAILVNPNNFQEIAESIRLVLSNNELKNELVKNGLAQAKKFSWQKTAKAYLDLFNN